MKRFSLIGTAILVGIMGALVSAPTAFADEDREKKEERRVLRAKDVTTVNLSEEYRKLARQKRQESMDHLKRLLREGTAQGETKAQMLLRLADLYFEEGRDLRMAEEEKFQKIFDACFNDDTCNSENLQADYTKSTSWQNKSIKLYQQILSNYPQYQRADEATFYLASALQEIGKRDKAVKEFTRLVRTYPESRLVSDAYVMIGEYYFDNNNAYKALVAYRKAASFGRDSEKYAFSMYKLAWCYYNVGEYGKSIDTMKAVVAHAMAEASKEDGKARSRIQLQEEALKDLVRFFADAGEMDEAYAYFNKLGKKDLIRSMLKRLATTYFEQGKFEQCIQTYRRLIAEDPQSPKAPDYQNEIVMAYQKMGRKADTIGEIDRMLKTYGKSSPWARANASDQDALQEAQDYLEKNLRTVAINYHNDAKKLGSGSAAKESYALAYKAYRVYLSEFANSKYSYEVRYAFAELLYKVKKYDEAYEQYMKVVETDKKGKHAEFCASSAVFAADKMVKKTVGKQKAAPGKSTAPIELEEWEQKLLAALDQYATLFPNEKKTRNIIYRSAYLLYNKNQFKEASDRFRVVIGMNPKSKEAEQAAELILDSFTLVEDWTNLKDVSKAFYDQEGLGSSKFKKDIYNTYERASFKLIEVSLDQAGKKAEAAEAYWAFYAEFPESEVADKALNNSAVYFYATEQLMRAMKVRHELIEKFPKSKYYNDHVAELGFAYESVADFEKAAKWYEKLYSVDKEHKSAADAIYSAALFRNALGDWLGAIKNYKAYITTYPDKENIIDVSLLIGQIYEDNSKWAEAAKIYYAFFTAKDADQRSLDLLFFARLHYGLMLEKQGQTSSVKKHWQSTLNAWEKVPEADRPKAQMAIEVVAQIMYDQTAKEYKTFTALDVGGPGKVIGNNKRAQKKANDQVAKQLGDKAKALGEISGSYTEIINTGAGEWGIAALVRLGQCYENMGETLKTAWVPDWLNDDQRDMYKMALEDKVYPQEEKASEAYGLALSKSFELSLYNENTAFATRRLGELRPFDYPALREVVITPRYTTSKTTRSDFETEM